MLAAKTPPEKQKPARSNAVIADGFEHPVADGHAGMPDREVHDAVIGPGDLPTSGAGGTGLATRARRMRLDCQNEFTSCDSRVDISLVSFDT